MFLNYVQELRLRYVPNRQGSHNDNNINHARSIHDSQPFQKMLQALPNDSLKKFEYDDCTQPGHEQLRLLWRRQKNLTNLQLEVNRGSWTKPIEGIIKEDADLLTSLKSIQEISLFVGAAANLELCGKVLRKFIT